MKLTPLCVLALMLLACGDNDSKPPHMKAEATLAGACSVVCNKLKTCDALQGLLVEDCVRGCDREETAAVSGRDGCAISQEQASTCISEIEEFSCPALREGEFPKICSFCEEPSRNANARAGSGAPKPEGATSACPDLHMCCDQISAPDQQSFCNMVVRMNNPGLCGAVLPTYRTAGACK